MAVVQRIREMRKNLVADIDALEAIVDDSTIHPSDTVPEAATALDELEGTFRREVSKLNDLFRIGQSDGHWELGG